jgi:uncharacterized protein
LDYPWLAETPQERLPGLANQTASLKNAHRLRKRETRSAPETSVMVECELARMIIRDNMDQQFIFLQEKNGLRKFPIIIGMYEAMEIARKIAEETTARPLTHDLLRSILEALGVRLKRIVVDELRSNTFHAKLHLEVGEKLHTVDSRPSDAIALAVATGAPIFVEEAVLEAVCREDVSE